MRVLPMPDRKRLIPAMFLKDAMRNSGTDINCGEEIQRSSYMPRINSPSCSLWNENQVKGIRDSPDCAYFVHYEGNRVSNNVSNYVEGRESPDSGKVRVFEESGEIGKRHRRGFCSQTDREILQVQVLSFFINGQVFKWLKKAKHNMSSLDINSKLKADKFVP